MLCRWQKTPRKCIRIFYLWQLINFIYQLLCFLTYNYYFIVNNYYYHLILTILLICLTTVTMLILLYQLYYHTLYNQCQVKLNHDQYILYKLFVFSQKNIIFHKIYYFKCHMNIYYCYLLFTILETDFISHLNYTTDKSIFVYSLVFCKKIYCRYMSSKVYFLWKRFNLCLFYIFIGL